MPTVLLVRHARSTANTSGVLAGWTPGVGLDGTGREQAAGLGRRLADLPIAAVVTSPLQRCRETAALALDGAPTAQVDHRLGECRYGDWTGRPLKELARDPLWRVIQAHPSAVTFPGPHGESMPAMQQRAVAAVREHDARVADEHGPDALWLAFSHGDVIKAVIADALGMHLDSFQRIMIDPCSVSAVRYTQLRPFALRVNDASGDLSALRPPSRRRRRARTDASRAVDPVGVHVPPRRSRASSDAVVGGSTGVP